MESAIVLNADDIKKIVAEKFHVAEKNVIKSQYTYTVVGVTCESILGYQNNEQVKSALGM